MKVYLYGKKDTDWKPAMLPRIQQGFVENDWFVVNKPAEANLLYCNDPDGYQDFSDDSDKFNDKVKIINILDLPDFLPNFPEILERYKKTIESEDVVTSISKFVSGQVKNYLNIESPVIYQPSKPIKHLKSEKKSGAKLRFLYVGRANSPNKKFSLVKDLIKKYYSEGQLITVGTEDPKFGKFAGVVSDEWLNNFYNMCDFVLQPSDFEGIGLSSVESILSKTPVILNKNCAASREFLPEFCAEANSDSMQEKILEIQNNREKFDKIIENYHDKYQIQFSPKRVAENIIEVYEKFKKV